MKRRKTKVTMPVVLPPAVAEEFDRQWAEKENEVFESCKRDIITQILATLLCYLHTRYGWKAKVLNSIKDGIQDLFVAMQTNGIMGQEFNTQHCIDYMLSIGVTFDRGGEDDGEQP